MQAKAYLSVLSEGTGLSSLILLSGIKGLILYLLFHGVASFLIGSLIFLLLPPRYRKNTPKKLLLPSIVVFIFLTGPLGVFGGLLLYVMLLKRKRVSLPVEKLFLEEIIIPEVEKRTFGEAVGEKLNEKLILLLTKFPSSQAMQLLKRALAVDKDEVRLIAFATISRMEKEIFERINILLKELERAKDEEELFRIYASLAELYWEPVFLNIADEELEEFYLKTALEYGLKALEIREDEKLLFLIGRIYLRLKEYDKAEHFLIKATEKGMPLEKVAPYLMEVYFVRRDWEALKELSSYLRERVIPDAKALSIIRVWV
ncbi:tetratricopeptide repeat protein [Aquifex sp.]